MCSCTSRQKTNRKFSVQITTLLAYQLTKNGALFQQLKIKNTYGFVWWWDFSLGGTILLTTRFDSLEGSQGWNLKGLFCKTVIRGCCKSASLDSRVVIRYWLWAMIFLPWQRAHNTSVGSTLETCGHYREVRNFSNFLSHSDQLFSHGLSDWSKCIQRQTSNKQGKNFRISEKNDLDSQEHSYSASTLFPTSNVK